MISFTMARPSCAFLVFSAGEVRLIETFPDLREGVLGDSKAGVLDRDEDFFSFLQGLNVDHGIVSAEFHRVVDEVIEHLLDFFHIRVDRKARLVEKQGKTDAAFIAAALESFQRPVDDFVDVKIAHLHEIAVIVEGVQSQKTFREFFQAFRLREDDMEVPILDFYRNRSVENRLHIAFDGGQGRAEIVGNVGDKFSLGFSTLSGPAGQILELAPMYSSSSVGSLMKV